MACPKMLPKVVLKPASVMGEWMGMNPLAAKEIGFSHKIPDDEVWVSADSKRPFETALHELVEYALMGCRRYRYKPAHAATDSLVLLHVMKE